MELDPVFLSRLQFAFVVSFQIVFPSFTIGLAAWLATIEGVRLATGNPVYRRVFDFWLSGDSNRMKCGLPPCGCVLLSSAVNRPRSIRTGEISC